MKYKKPKIKILIAYHKDTYRFKSDILIQFMLVELLPTKKPKKNSPI